MRNIYPFPAIVGQDLMKCALLLNAVNPRIGGVLIRGERGTDVILTIERFGENEWIEYTLIREDIKVNDLFY